VAKVGLKFAQNYDLGQVYHSATIQITVNKTIFTLKYHNTMRTLLLSLFFVSGLSVSNLSAQGSLQFNRALHQEAINTSGTTFTVPAGKVWKITSFGAYSGRFTCTQFATFYLKIANAYATGRIDGGSAWANTCSASCTGSLLFGSTVQGVFWIEGGTTIELGFLSSFNASCSSVYVNGIEFNVLP
jgi:hypothetical protein